MRKSKTEDRSRNLMIKTLILVFLSSLLIFGLTKLPILIDKVVNNTTKINEYSILYDSLLGITGEKKLLVLFMNNAEQRYGGGFIGSVGYITVNKGKIKSEPVRSVYYYDRTLKKDFSASVDLSDPELQTEANTLRNSGQNINWKKNGERAKEIFEFQTGKKVDLVIGITPEVLKSLLNELGPVYLDNYSKEVNSKNIIDSLQTEVEFGKDKVEGKDPKSIISDLANRLLEKISTKNISDLLGLVETLKEEVYKKQIIFYSQKEQLGKTLNRLGFDGSVKINSNDYFMISEKNESVDKSSAYIDTSVNRTISINRNGEAEINVEIIRKQFRDKSIPYIDPNNNEFTYLIKENMSKIRIAIPRNSIIINRPEDVMLKKIDTKEFIDMYEFNSDLIPQEGSSYKFAYKLPIKIEMEKSIEWNSLVQLQNGGWQYKLNNTMLIPDDFSFISSNKNVKLEENKVYYNEDINKDLSLNLIYEKKQ